MAAGAPASRLRPEVFSWAIISSNGWKSCAADCGGALSNSYQLCAQRIERTLGRVPVKRLTPHLIQHLYAQLLERGLSPPGLTAMRDRCELRADAKPRDLAVATKASLHGGLLLAQAARSIRPLRVALDAALKHLRGWAPSTAGAH